MISQPLLVDSLLRAWAKHGSLHELYADNGKGYHSKGLVVACARLQIAKLHRPPREPETGGLIERFFQTVQTQLGAEVQAMSTLTLEQLNQAFEAWLQSAYHREVHSSTQQTPQHRYFTEHRIGRPVSNPISTAGSSGVLIQPTRMYRLTGDSIRSIASCVA